MSSQRPRANYGVLRIAALARDEIVDLATNAGAYESPDLRTAVDIATSALDGTDTDAPAYLRYALRMAGRSTPFGLFAGTAPLTWSRDRNLDVGTPRALVRADVHVLETLVKNAGADDQSPVRTNPALIHADGTFRFQEGPGAEHSAMVELAATPAVQLVADFAVSSRSIDDVCQMLLQESPGLEAEPARRFVQQLLDTGLLIRETVLVQPGHEPGDLARAALDQAPEVPEAAALEAIATVTGAPLQPHEVPARLDLAWNNAMANLEGSCAEELAAIERSQRFHVDLEYPAEGLTLDSKTVTGLEDTLELVAAHCPMPDGLKEFKQRFEKRYEDAEVPLLVALDIDRGVCDPASRRSSQIAKDAGVGAPTLTVEDSTSVPTTALAALSHWTNTGESFDLAQLPRDPNAAPSANSAYSVLASLIGDTDGDYDAVFVSGTTQSSQALIGRFALPRTVLGDHALRLAADEAAALPADHVFAELSAHMPGRIGNVELRPKLTTESIDLFGSGGGTMRLADLALSLERNVLRLRHVPTDRWVLPVLTSAVNPDRPDVPHVYRFLAQLACVGGAMWSWGPLDRLAHLPRVVCNRTIVSPERWVIERADVRAGLDHADPAQWLRSLPNIGTRRWLGVAQGDHVLPFNLDLPATIVASFERVQRGDGSLAIVELPHLEHPAAHGPNGRHAAELVLPVLRRPLDASRVERPGSAPDRGWMSHSLYCGNADADEVVRGVSNLARELIDVGVVASWFFVRYGAGGNHIRLRLLPSSDQYRSQVLAAVDRWTTDAMRAGVLSGFAAVPYRPEVTRYGGPTCLPLCEDVFSHDSEAIATGLSPAPSDAGRLYGVVASILQWSSLLPDPLDFIKKSIDGYWTEFERSAKNKVGALYKEHRDQLHEHLEAMPPSGELLVALKAVADDLDRQIEAGELTESSRSMVFSSLVHMHANRMFRTDQRRQELVAYELARRVFVSNMHSPGGH